MKNYKPYEGKFFTQEFVEFFKKKLSEKEGSDKKGSDKEVELSKNEDFIKTIVNDFNIENLIKQVVGRSPDDPNEKKEGPMKGPFERGVVIINGLNENQAKEITTYLKGLEQYERKSTHGDLVNGHDLDEKDYVQTKNEIFRTVIFSYPKKYTERTDLNDGAGCKEESENYYFRIKPESYGMNNKADIAWHSLDYIYTRIYNKYKVNPGYYGDGNSNCKGNKNADINYRRCGFYWKLYN